MKYLCSFVTVLTLHSCMEPQVELPPPATEPVSDITTFDTLEPQLLLMALFETDSISPAGEAIWLLTPEEKLTMEFNNDTLGHTSYDTTFYYKYNNHQYATVIFSTLPYYEGQKSNCHPCGVYIGGASFIKQQDGFWKLQHFSKQFATIGSF